MAHHPQNLSLQPLIPLPQSDQKPSNGVPDLPSQNSPNSPFSSLFDPPPNDAVSSKPLFPVAAIPIPNQSLTPVSANNAPNIDPADSPSATFGEFVSSDPLQDSQLIPSFSPIEPYHVVPSRPDDVTPQASDNNRADDLTPWSSTGTATGLTFVQEAAARSKARAEKVMKELSAGDSADPLGWLSAKPSTTAQQTDTPQEEPFDDWDGLDGVEAEATNQEKEREMQDEIAARAHLPHTPRASRSGSPVGNTRRPQSRDQGRRQSDSDDDIIDLRTGRRERPKAHPVPASSSSATKAIPIHRSGADTSHQPHQSASNSTSSSYLNFTLPRKWFSSGPSPPQVSTSPSVAKTGLTRQMSAGEFTELPHANLAVYGGHAAGGTISEANSPRVPLSGLFESAPITPFAKKSFAPISGAPAFRPDEDWNPSGFEYDENSKKDTLGSETVKLTGRYDSTTPVLTEKVADMIRPHLPPLPRLARSWTLLYSTDQHGISISTLYKNVEKVYGMNGGCVLAVREALDEDGDGDIDAEDRSRGDQKGAPCFGVWLGSGIKCNEGSYYGSGESFLWKTVGANSSSHLGPPKAVKVFKWTGRNDYVALCESDYLSFGGGDGKYGLYVDSSFVDGTSERCETFANETLCGDQDISGRARFECLALEVWRVGT